MDHLTGGDAVQCPHQPLRFPGQGTQGLYQAASASDAAAREDVSSTEGQEEAGATVDELLMFSRQSQKEVRVQ